MKSAGLWKTPWRLPLPETLSAIGSGRGGSPAVVAEVLPPLPAGYGGHARATIGRTPYREGNSGCHTIGGCLVLLT
ncbi:hypothetical protein Pve01_64160 [Planomonospora venezuelensis]|uniref:Uncharacterized protein n=1 Tax=Planomonospora venezuelensis TaxID=1999 RepID=A0A841CW62_PLAVE|nr:hypothetical protein [Planomonospora venezuelensis]GIN04758.1 hypothetical protein Pve01_64160 [Planomonospora venezuelensis]